MCSNSSNQWHRPTGHPENYTLMHSLQHNCMTCGNNMLKVNEKSPTILNKHLHLLYRQHEQYKLQVANFWKRIYKLPPVVAMNFNISKSTVIVTIKTALTKNLIYSSFHMTLILTSPFVFHPRLCPQKHE
jgi:hypothetical protein